MKKFNSKAARKALMALGISEDDPKYAPRLVPVRYKSVAIPKSMGEGFTPTMRNLNTSTRFYQMPIMEKVNPYRRLLKAMMEGTYSEKLRLEVEAFAAKEVPREPQVF